MYRVYSIEPKIKFGENMRERAASGKNSIKYRVYSPRKDLDWNYEEIRLW